MTTAWQPDTSNEGRQQDQEMISRRALLKGATALGLTGFGLGTFAFAIEPRFLLRVRHYRLTPPSWPKGLHLQLAVIADLHASEPYMPPSRIEEIVATTNALAPDAILLLGDYASSHPFQTRRVPPSEWAPILARLKAPLGTHA
ncbi:MAG: metallophosphoesterase, partial [Proteobacteria bacterium]|nr:metallophosphoesterase [Pseudomonadota bacterium]